MKSLAFAKQVPSTTEVGIDDKGCLKREGVQGGVNPDDEAAVELAALWAEAVGGEAAVATMAPAAGEEMLKDLVAKGCAESWHLMDDRLAGADITLTARALAGAVQIIDPQVVFMGASSADGKSGMVPPAVAALLGWAYVGNVTQFESLGETLVLWQRRGGLEAKVQVKTPAVVSVFKTVSEPRIADVMAILMAPEATTVDADRLGLTESDLDWSLRGRVVETTYPEQARKKKILGGAEALGDLLAALKGEGL
ncbi:hypothetical protein H8D30_00450 [bacterium]|nr:hypothetical protein [bacterium]